MADTRPEVLEESDTRTLEIQCPVRCSPGCTVHAGLTEKDWRAVRTLPPGTSIDHARTIMGYHEESGPKSGPYRLVEIREIRKRTLEVL